MQSDLTDLSITPSQLEKLTGMEISSTFMGRVFRPIVFRSFDRFFAFLLTELLTLGLILIFCLPIGLVIGRGLGILSNGSVGIFLTITIGVSLLLLGAWNGYMVWKGKQLRVLSHLLDQVDKHNEIIAAVDVIDELGQVQSRVQLLDRSEILKALAATRESLINALMTEKILRKHQRFIARRQELFTSIETNLATLQTLQIDNRANEYGQLLNEALQIGLSIRRELNQLQDESDSSN